MQRVECLQASLEKQCITNLNYFQIYYSIHGSKLIAKHLILIFCSYKSTQNIFTLSQYVIKQHKMYKSTFFFCEMAYILKPDLN